jgi:hypothetical protein
MLYLNIMNFCRCIVFQIENAWMFFQRSLAVLAVATAVFSHISRFSHKNLSAINAVDVTSICSWQYRSPQAGETLSITLRKTDSLEIRHQECHFKINTLERVGYANLSFLTFVIFTTPVSFEMASKQNSWPILKTHPFLRSRN